MVEEVRHCGQHQQRRCFQYAASARLWWGCARFLHVPQVPAPIPLLSPATAESLEPRPALIKSPSDVWYFAKVNLVIFIHLPNWAQLTFMFNWCWLMYIFWLFIEKCRILSRVVERRCLSGLRLLAHLALIWNHIRSRSSFPQKKGSRSTTSTSEAATKGSKPHSSVSYSAKKGRKD